VKRRGERGLDRVPRRFGDGKRLSEEISPELNGRVNAALEVTLDSSPQLSHQDRDPRTKRTHDGRDCLDGALKRLLKSVEAVLRNANNGRERAAEDLLDTAPSRVPV